MPHTDNHEYIANSIKELQSIVVDLVVNHSVPHQKIKNDIHEAVMEAVKDLPKIPVLYNKTYGGYGYSKHFRRCKLDVKIDAAFSRHHHMRVCDVPYIEAYGKHCKNEFPFIARMIATYNARNLNGVCKYMHTLDYTHEKLQKTAAVKQRIMETDMSQFGDDCNVTYINVYCFCIDDVIKYNHSALVAFCNAQIELHQKTLHDTKALLLKDMGDEQMCDDMIASVTHLFEEEKEAESQAWYQKPKWNEVHVPDKGLIRLSFTHALSFYNESHFAVWKCQLHYREAPMRFLLLYPKYFIEDIDMCSDMEMGLLCASDAYCKLAINYVPPLVHWSIEEYDGLESVCMT